jgi:hypothetical protein
MNTNKRLFAGACVLLSILAVLFLSVPISGRSRVYEVRPEITLPHTPTTDAARAIDAYERLMNRYIDLSEQNNAYMNTSLAEIKEKLDLLSVQLLDLSERIEKIEKFVVPVMKRRVRTRRPTPAPEQIVKPGYDSNTPVKQGY